MNPASSLIACFHVGKVCLAGFTATIVGLANEPLHSPDLACTCPCKHAATQWLGQCAQGHCLACRTGRQPDPNKTVYDAYLFSKELNADVDLPFSTYVTALLAPLWSVPSSQCLALGLHI